MPPKRPRDAPPQLEPKKSTMILATAQGGSLRGRHPIDTYITINVGGVKYVTTIATLRCKEPNSLLARHFEDPEAMLPVDAEGNFFLDRDGKCFRHILNYLRGYPLCVKPEELPVLSADVNHFSLEGMKPLLGIDISEDWRFVQGPGVVGPHRLHFRTGFVVSLCGDSWLTTGVHSQAFRAERADYVGIGIVSPRCVDQAQEFHKVENSAVYYMSGVLYHNFPDHVKMETTESYGDGDLITVILDIPEMKVSWKRNSDFIQSVPFPDVGEGFRFAVVLKKTSTVVAVPIPQPVASALLPVGSIE